MTGYAAAPGSHGGTEWHWDIRSVNAKGRDVRFRLPEPVETLEPDLRRRVEAQVVRGNVTVTLRLQRRDAGAGAALSDAALETALRAVARVEAHAALQGLTLSRVSAAEILAMVPAASEAEDGAERATLAAAVRDSFAAVFDAYLASRAAEGAALQEVLLGQLDEIAALTRAAGDAAAERAPAQRERLRAQIARLLGETDAVDEARLAQELALLAVKSDVTEEIDRLQAHVAAAREILGGAGAVGRQLDFLMQEFNREANTLCAKAQATDLTRIGLALKTVIDRLREQVQNLE
ncbi:YicC/YloC family endoribonuclease [Roseivivax sp. CAU 1761]